MDKLWQDAGGADRATDDPALVIDVGGFEGPLDLLLHLARTQKVDLARISVLALAEQYLQFIDSVRKVRIEWPPTIWSWRPGSPTSSPNF